jgi:GNAT superfamily N-acetyltransferase
MNIHYELSVDIPQTWLEIWSNATQHELHLTPESPESLRQNVIVAAIAVANDEPVGFAGIIEARTKLGHGITKNGQKVAELGGAYVLPSLRKHGVWQRLLELRVEYARKQNIQLVCISSNPTVQSGLQKFGAVQMCPERHNELMNELCLGCNPDTACAYCPLIPGAAWLVE